MDAAPKLPKATTARIYCLCFVAERSVVFAQTNPTIWRDFLAFFSPEQKMPFNDIYREIPSVTTPDLPRLQMPGSFNMFLLKLSAFFRPCPLAFAFDPSEIGFIRRSLESFQQLLQLPTPDIVRLSATRRNLGNCQWIIERKWFNRRRWDILRRADHFCRNPILGPALDVDSAVRTFLS